MTHHIVRMLQTNLDGMVPCHESLLSISGVTSTAGLCLAAKVEPMKLMGDCTVEELDALTFVISDSDEYKIGKVNSQLKKL
jgi:ribosomal protein S13